MGRTHKGMLISEKDWTIFIAHLKKSLHKFKVKEPEFNEVLVFIESLKSSMVEVK
jgi:hemoglobin